MLAWAIVISPKREREGGREKEREREGGKEGESERETGRGREKVLTDGMHTRCELASILIW